MSLLDQLVDFYYKYDQFQTSYLPKEEIEKIYKYMLDRNRIHFVQYNNELLGYCESFRISYETFGKIICGWNIYEHLGEVDIEHGNIAYVANITIHPDYRGSNTIKMLRNDFFSQNIQCEYFVGQAWRKKHQPIKVFSKQKAFEKWVKENLSWVDQKAVAVPQQ